MMCARMFSPLISSCNFQECVLGQDDEDMTPARLCTACKAFVSQKQKTAIFICLKI